MAQPLNRQGAHPQASHGLRTIRELRRGSSGVIMLAEEAASGGSVAVKLLPRQASNTSVPSRPPSPSGTESLLWQ